MKRDALSLIIIIAITLAASSVWTIRPDSFFSSTIFTIAGIMFSVGIGLIVTFNPSGVKNRAYLGEIRQTITDVRNSFMVHFSILTVSYILNQYVTELKYEINFHYYIDMCFSISIFLCLLMIHSSIFFIVNFLAIQKLNNDIFDVINNEKP